MRTYYDHETAYRRIAAAGGSGWDDLYAEPQLDSYTALDAFLASTYAPAQARVLDLGCGGGQAAQRLAARGYSVIGVDFSETAIALAQQNVPGATFRVGDCLALGELGPFDLAIDNHALHCLIGEDRGRFLGEVARVLVAGGLLFSETMSRDRPDLAALDVDPETFVSRHGNRYWTTRAELDADLEQAGFDIVFRGVRDFDLVTYARRRS